MRPTEEAGIVTVAAIRESGKDGGLECLFNERQQIFVLAPSARDHERTLGRMREALDRKAPVRAVLNPRQGVVKRIDPPSDGEIREFEELHVLLEKPEKTRRIDVSSIDPTTFNFVDHRVKSAGCCSTASRSTSPDASSR